MKSKLIISTFFVCLGSLVFAQRGDNQVSFKNKSAGQFELNDRIGGFDNAPATRQNQSYYSNTNRRMSAPTTVIKDNEVIININAIMNVKASKFLAVFNLTQVGETAAKTDEVLNTRIDGFINALKQMGVNDKDIYVDMIYLIPTFEFEVGKKLFSKTYNEVPTGFEMQKNIHINFTDINKVDDIVTLAAKNEIYDLVKLDFFVENTEGVYDTLRSKSVEVVNKKIASVKKVNLNLSDKFHVVRENNFAIYPETQYPSYDAFVSQSIEAVTKKTGVTKIRKPKTVAYDQKSYADFDIVVNPEILEPVVQYVYTLQVKYTIDKVDEKPKNNYLIVTPNGEVKKIELLP